MGLRCLIGHEYGEPETARERDDRGDEVVVTIREFKECTRCGEQQVISENTEVRAVAPDPDTEPEPEPDPTPESGADAGGSEFDEVTAAEDDGVILDDGADEERAPGEWPGEDEADAEEPASEESASEASAPKEPVEWPDHEGEDEGIDAEAPGEPAAWPDHEGEDEGIDAEAPADAEADVTFRGGLAPESAPGSSAATESDADAGADGASAGATAEDVADAGPAGIRSATSGPDPTDQRVAGIETTIVCPECDHSAEPVDSSLRPGDICPECGRGYLTEREQ